MRILTDRDVRALLPMAACMDVVESALRHLAADEAINPLRSMVRFPDGTGLLGLMPAWLGEPRCAGAKIVSVTPANHGSRYDAHQGMVLLFEPEHGRPAAVIDASSVTAIRTAATSGVATRHLARTDARTLALIGSGVQAASHLDAMLEARGFSDVVVFSPTRHRVDRFVERVRERHDIHVRVAASARDAVADADVICTTTSSAEPVIEGPWLAPGCHVNAVGACFPTARELDGAAMARARLFVDRRESARHESGDFLLARAEGAIDDDHIVGELGEVLLGRCEGRTSDTGITIFESLGLGVEDLATAHWIWETAVARDVGIEVELGGLREDV